LPKQINFTTSQKNISYLYSANGTKLTVTDTKNNRVDYIGNIVYKNDKIDYIQTAEGRFVYETNGSVHYEFYAKDHLGNVRATYTRSPIHPRNIHVTQLTDYYPFGLPHGKPNGTNKYLYNGKEIDNELNMYDYGARMYALDRGQFTTMDRFAEKYYSYSNYSYAANNPILFIDVNGDSLKVNDIGKFNLDMKYQFGATNNFFGINENGNISMTKEGMETFTQLAIEDPNNPLFASLGGMISVINSDVMTNVVYSDDIIKDGNGNPLSANHVSTGQAKTGIRASDTGGEFTLTTADNKGLKSNHIFVNPARNHISTINTLKQDYTVQDIINHTEYNTIINKQPRHTSLMHGIGHVLYKSSSQQSKVIMYDNFNRKLSGVQLNTDPDGSHKDK